MLPEWLLPTQLPPMHIKGSIKRWLERDPRSIFCDKINERRRANQANARQRKTMRGG